MVLAFLCAELFVSRTDLPSYPSLIEARIEHAREKLKRCAAESVLLIGDSTLRFAIDEQLLESEIALPVCSLSIMGSASLISDYWMLAEAVAIGHRPVAVIFMHSARVWDRRIDDATTREFTLLFEPYSFASISLKLFQQLSIVQKSKSYSLAHIKEGVGFIDRRGKIKKEIANNERKISEIGLPLEERELVFPDWSKRRQPGYRRDFTPTDFQEFWLERTLRLASAYELSVWYVTAPTWDTMLEKHRVRLQNQRQWLQARLRQYSRTRLFNEGEIFPVATEDLGDTRWHLHPRLIQPHTKWFARELLQEFRLAEEMTDKR